MSVGIIGVFYFVCLVFIWLRIEVFRLSNVESLAAAVEQLQKAKAEIVSKLVALEDAVAAGEDLTGPLSELAAVAQSLDDVVPDAPEAPVEE